MFDECLQNTVPLLLQGRDSVSGHWHATVLRLHAQILNRDLSEVNLVSLIFVLFNRLKFHKFGLLLRGEVFILVDLHLIKDLVDFALILQPKQRSVTVVKFSLPFSPVFN